jgi:hypothetical protein
MKSQAQASNIGLLLLFPGFFFWHFGLATGIIPFHVGLYGLISAILAVIFLTVFVMKWMNLAARSYFALTAWALVAYGAIWTMANAVGNPPPGATAQFAVTLISWIALLSAGAFMRLDSPAFRSALLISWATMSAIVLVNVDGLYFNARAFAVSDEAVATYQGFARSMMVTSILILAFVDTLWKRILISLASIAIVFLMMARSELYGLIVAILVVEGIYAIRRGRRMAILMVAIAGFTLLVLNNLEYLMSSRQLQILNLSEATSWLARQEAQRIALEQISHSPLSGMFGGHYYASPTGGLGNYAHNALSAWVTLGLPGFLIYVGLSLWATAGSVMKLLRTEDSAWRLSVYLNASAFVLIIFAKSVFWTPVALGWGVYIGTSHLLRRRAVARQLSQSVAVAPHSTPSMAYRP